MTSSSSKYILVVGGPCGCGKSSVGEDLSKLLAAPFIEGDSVHPKENVIKMSQGIPLTDEDRWGWLKQIAQQSYSALESSTTNTTHKKNKFSIVSCSSLKKVYRDSIIEEVESRDPSVKVIFVFLNISIQASKARVAARKNHYMKPVMVDSQFEILQTPVGDEVMIGDEVKSKESEYNVNLRGNAIVIDPDVKDRHEITDEVFTKLKALGIAE